jgi:phenylacetate-CoA ligase
MTAAEPREAPPIGAAFPTRAIEGGYALLARSSRLDVWRRLQALEANQWRPFEELRALRWRKLQALLGHAFEHVPFYRALWTEHGVDPRRFRSEEDLGDLPVVTKRELTAGQAEDAFRLTGRPGLEQVRTSGTTGPRFAVPATVSSFQAKYAGHLRQMYASGWRLGMRSASLYYSAHPQFQGRYTGRPERDSFTWLRRAALRLAHRRRALTPYWPAQSGDARFPAMWYRDLARWRPFLFETMEFNLPVLRDYIEAHDLPRVRIPRTYVLGTLGPALRAALEACFQTEIFDRYSPHEMEGIAFACRLHRGMHVAIDSYHVEFLDDQGRRATPGETAHLVITDLDAELLPLIRYRIGDLGADDEEPCACGRGLPLMRAIQGRAADRFALRDGRTVPPASIAATVQDDPAVSLFQVVQDASHAITVRVVPRSGRWTGEVPGRLQATLRALLGREEAITVERVDTIPIEPTGKVAWCKRLAGEPTGAAAAVAPGGAR